MVDEAKQFFSAHRRAFAWSVLGGICLLSTIAVNMLTLKKQMTFGDTPPTNLMGWDGQDAAAKAWEQNKGKFPKFKISGDKHSSAGKVVKLWDAAKAVNGEHLPTFRQLIGDCVGASHKQALDILQCIGAAKGENEFKPIYHPYHYAYSRMVIGKGQIRGPDGNVGSWQAAGLKEGGAIPDDTEGVEPYSEAVIRRLAVRKPDAKLIAIGKQHLLGEAAQVTTYAEARDAISNGYPVNVCSNRGFEMRPRVEGGKHWGVPSGQWAHSMCFIGVDDTVTCPSFAGGGKGALYCLNSWGPDAHGKPAGDEPPGGFWVSSRVAESMLKQQDSFALSAFSGFPAQDLDWVIPIGQINRMLKQHAQVARAAEFKLGL